MGVLVYDKTTKRVKRIINGATNGSPDSLCCDGEAIITDNRLVKLYSESSHIPDIGNKGFDVIWDGPSLSRSFDKVSAHFVKSGNFLNRQSMKGTLNKEHKTICYRHINSLLHSDIVEIKPDILYLVFDYPYITFAQIDLLKTIPVIAVPSEFCRDTLQSFGIESVVIPHGINTDIFSYYPRKYDLPLCLFTIVSTDPLRKGFNNLVSIFKEQFANNPRIQLIVKTEKDIKEQYFPQIKDCHNLHLIDDDLTDNELASLMKECHVGIFPFIGEGFGLGILECLATGMPCVVTNYGGPRDYIRYNTSIFLQPKVVRKEGVVYNNEDLKSLLIQFYNSSSQLYNIHRELSKVSFKSWSWEEQVKKFQFSTNEAIEVYEEDVIINKESGVALNGDSIFGEALKKAMGEGRIPLIYPPTIPFNHLYQRPQHVLNTFKQNGYFSIWVDEYDGATIKVEDNFWIVNSREIVQNIDFGCSPLLYITWAQHLKELNLYKNKPIVWYDIIDDIDIFWKPDSKEYYEECHRHLVQGADILSYSADSLLEDFCYNNSKAILAKNGVCVEDFWRQGDARKTELQFDKPVIGYYGAIAPWLDWDLIFKVIERFPDYIFLFIGPEYEMDAAKLRSYSNVVMHTQVSYRALPNFSRLFDIAWIPFKDNHIIKACNPLKMYEYMASEHIIITTDFPEARKEPVYRGKDVEEIIELLDSAMNNELNPLATKDYIDTKSWSVRLSKIIEADRRLR